MLSNNKLQILLNNKDIDRTTLTKLIVISKHHFAKPSQRENINSNVLNKCKLLYCNTSNIKEIKEDKHE